MKLPKSLSRRAVPQPPQPAVTPQEALIREVLNPWSSPRKSVDEDEARREGYNVLIELSKRGISGPRDY